MIEQLKTFWAEKKYRLIFIGILLAALAMRLLMFFGPMEYDEIWSLRYINNSVWKILTDLATPNNHPLNSLFMKLWRSCLDISELPQLTRIHSLVFGMLSVALTGMLARGLFHSRSAALLSMLFFTFDAAAVYYCDQARGYSMQLFFLLCFANGLVWSGKLRKFLPWKYLPEAAIVVGALGAVLSVPTAPIFLAAMIIGGKVIRRRMPEASVLIAVGIAAALVAAYLGINQTVLHKAQADFGTRLTSVDAWIGFTIMIVQDFFPLATAPFLLVLAATDRKRGLMLLLCAAVVIGSAAVVSAGESRVYMPLCALVALGCGRGAHALFTVTFVRNDLRLRLMLAVASVFLAGFGYFQLYGIRHVTDYYGWFKAGSSMPPDHLIVYPATSGFPLVWNNDREKLAQDQWARMTYDGIGSRRLLCFGIDPGHINGGALRESRLPQKDLELPVKGAPRDPGGFPAVEYKLHPTVKPRPGEPFIAILPDDDMKTVVEALKDPNFDLQLLNAEMKTVVEAMKDPECDLLLLNPFFPGLMIYVPGKTSPTVRQYLQDHMAGIYTFAPEAPAEKK